MDTYSISAAIPQKIIRYKIIHLDNFHLQGDGINNPTDRSVINLNITRDRDKMIN